jgi:hypothetical protein
VAPLRRSLVSFAVVAIGIAAVACSDRVYMGEVKADAGAPGFTDPNNRDAALGDGGLACIATECPEPWATCMAEDKVAYKCGTDLLRDNDNCGACGNACPKFTPVHMTSRCSTGSCELECYTDPDMFNIGLEEWRNCNSVVDDGCEINVMDDANNCGACGNACPAGMPCLGGTCGCPKGQELCDDFGWLHCVDTQSDDRHCGGCGIKCTEPGDACSPKQPNTRYGCVKGECKKKCQNNYADCNNDLSPTSCGGDGCEVYDLTTKENCGGCGIKCTNPREECVDEGNGHECAVPCERFGMVLCDDRCVDLLNNVGACGACSAACRDPGPNQTSLCKKGMCVYECAPGFADCNGDASDGCETNINVHPGNCGGCGISCDLAAGQPCIEGQCLMTECDAGGPR